MSRWLLPLVAAIGALVGAAAIWSWDRLAAPGGVEQARIERVVRDYVLTHPEIIPEAMQRLQDRESGKAVAQNAGAITTPFAGAWAGNPKGDITLVEYFDYNCGYCRASVPLIERLIANDPNLRVVYRDLPVLAPSSRAAARVSLAAAAQGRFRAFHDALYAAGPVSDATIRAAATRAGVDPAGADAKAIEAEIGRNLDTAGKLGVTGTPSWVIGDRVLSGMLPIDQLEAAIAAARRR